MSATVLKMFHYVFFLMAGVCLFLSIPSSGLTTQRTALIIGNGAYKSAPLKNPVNDAKDMAAALQSCGFKVTLVLDSGRKEMRTAVRTFGDQISTGGVGLFYYAGHGIQVQGENYMIPVGVQVYAEDEIEDECLRISSVLRKMESDGNNMNIIILDACRNNPFQRGFRSSTKGLARVDAPTGSIIAYATAPGSVAADGRDRNGIYTAKLLKYIKTPGLNIERVFKKTGMNLPFPVRPMGICSQKRG